MRKHVIAGNWKMNMNHEEGLELAGAIKDGLGEYQLPEELEVILIPPFIHLSAIQSTLLDHWIELGAQNCSGYQDGAYTGEISANMLKSVGVNYVLVGHSERRSYFKENDKALMAKVQALLSKEIKVIFCCGEQLNEREAHVHFEEIEKQLQPLWELDSNQFSQLMIAYEPVWAIGTGVTASSEQAQEMHAFIRGLIAQNFSDEIAANTSILYGGSVKSDNAEELFKNSDVDGGLIGGASLKSEEFLAIIKAMSS